jgi:probable HAF family extracellular repeat protein
MLVDDGGRIRRFRTSIPSLYHSFSPIRQPIQRHFLHAYFASGMFAEPLIPQIISRPQTSNVLARIGLPSFAPRCFFELSLEIARRRKMKPSIARRIMLFGVSVLILAFTASPLRSQDPPGKQPAHYRVIDLGTLGGPVSSGNAINNVGWVTGSSNLNDTVQLAALWMHGQQISLGTLGGPSSDVAWPVKNNFGLISGISENGKHDPLNETFSCPVFGFSSGNSCVAFAWQNGVITELPGLGGNNSVGGGDNDLGQIVGWAENTIQDPTCAGTSSPPFVQFLQFEAVVWEPSEGKWHVRQLPRYPGDPDSAATAINDRGQVVGISGTCDIAIGAYSAIHAVLWQNGTPLNLGNLGGHGWNTPAAINNLGVVAGFANQPDDVSNGSLAFIPEAFVWMPEDGMQGLGTLPGDAISEATDINDQGQVVGVSYSDINFDNPRAFIFQNHIITPLNCLISASDQSKFDITSTGGINDSGEIAAAANLVSDGVVTSAYHAVLLVPTADQGGVAACGASSAVIPDEVQNQLRKRTALRHFGRSVAQSTTAQ